MYMLKLCKIFIFVKKNPTSSSSAVESLLLFTSADESVQSWDDGDDDDDVMMNIQTNKISYTNKKINKERVDWKLVSTGKTQRFFGKEKSVLGTNKQKKNKIKTIILKSVLALNKTTT